jgi:hypothetical protein
VEEGAPHPCADLDLIVIAPHNRWLTIEALLSEVLSAQPWLVDVQPHTLDSANSCLPSRLLLHTRSQLLCGKEQEFRPVAANDQTMRAHLRRYGAAILPDCLDGPKSLRLCQLKQITRSFGCLAFSQGENFSRDIATCLFYAEELSPQSGRMLWSCWDQVCEEEEPAPFDIAFIRTSLIQLSEDIYGWSRKVYTY